jgi:trimeric autotransporter adhesin
VSSRFLSKPLPILAILAALAVPSLSFAIQPSEQPGPVRLNANAFTTAELDVHPSPEIYKIGADVTALRVMDSFFNHHSAEWEVRWDRRSNRANLIQGAGVPLLPGRGNNLTRADLPVKVAGEIRLADVEALVRGFMGRFPELFNAEGSTFRLDPQRSVKVGPDGDLWFIELQQVHAGLPVDGASLFFRINNGNLVQFGSENVAPVFAPAKPRLDAAAAFQKALAATGFKLSEVSEIVEPGRLKYVPVLTRGERPAEAFTGIPGTGYQHRLVWEIAFRRQGEAATWQALVNARSGKVLEILDRNYYVTAQVSGGIYPETNTDAEVVRSFPFNNVTNGAAKTTDAAGNYDYSGGTATSTLNGKYIKITDNCGAISLSDSTTGNLAFGTGAGTDCTTPGGGAGNTHSARSGFYHLTNINRKASSFLPANAWLNGLLTANMNINSTCNAFWNGTTVNFYRSGGGCSNTGEIAAVFLHEWGHGADANTGGAASDKGTGEAVGDTFAFLETKSSCIGKNFQPGVNCANCTACTGVRDVKEFSTQGTRTIARPSTVADNNGINCDRYSCPYYQFIFIGAYQGPMGYEGHCESYIASSANWDLAQQLITRYGTTAGWAAMDAIWYKSLTPSKSAYRVVSGGKCNPAATVDGCGANNWYTVYLTADDNDGNLANGTPNACRIWDAFTAHGIACGARPVCTV